MKRLPQTLIVCFALASSPVLAQMTPRIARLPRRPAVRNTVQQIEAMQPGLARHAAIVFFGRVIEIARIVPDVGPAQPSMQITFTVETGIRGISSGERYLLLEWPGRWQAGERYRVGERYLMFLHAPNAAGLSSPVGGNAGRFLIDGNGTIDLSPALFGHTKTTLPTASNRSPVREEASPQEKLPPRRPSYPRLQVRPE